MNTPELGVALVTGAGSGIGRATAVLLARRGFRLALVGRRAEALAETARLIGAEGLHGDPGDTGERKESGERVEGMERRHGEEVAQIVCDVSEGAEIQAAVDRSVARLGGLDVVVNNAGLAELCPIASVGRDAIERSFRVNALGPALLIRAAWPHLCARRRGCVVNVSTMGTKDPFPGFFAYAAAKGALNVMTASCAKEGKGKGVRAFCVAPGAVETGMLRGLFGEDVVPREACLSAEEVAEVIVDCVMGRRDEEIGKVIYVSRN